MRDLPTYSNTAFICTSRAVSAQRESRTLLSWLMMNTSNRTMSMVRPPLKTYQVPSSILFLYGILVSIFRNSLQTSGLFFFYGTFHFIFIYFLLFFLGIDSRNVTISYTIAVVCIYFFSSVGNRITNHTDIRKHYFSTP